MATAPKIYYTPEQYLDLEDAAEYKSEYFAGQIFAMAGASEDHNTININVSSELRRQFVGRPCRVYGSDMRVRVEATGLYTYPDTVAVCGERQFEDAKRRTLLNPTLIVEVLSDSTEAYDRGEKFAQYQRLESLTDYLLIAQDKPRVEQYVRQGDRQWLLSVTDDLESVVSIASLDCSLALADIYVNVEFPR